MTTMDRLEAQQRITELSAELEEHNHRYYVLAAPVISEALRRRREASRPGLKRLSSLVVAARGAGR